MVVTRRQTQMMDQERDNAKSPTPGPRPRRSANGVDLRVESRLETVPVPGQAPFRPMATQAGTWPHMPWWHHTFCDPYERLNVWSHGVPGLIFLAAAPFVQRGSLPGGTPMAVFLVAAAITHISSACSHIWPDSIFWEKFDHFAIIATIAGTPLTSLMALGKDVRGVLLIFAGLLIAAAMPRAVRTVAFVGGGGLLSVLYAGLIVNPYLITQLVLYLFGAIMFLRNKGEDLGHLGLHDHHFLHYFSTIAALFQIWNLLDIAGVLPHRSPGLAAAGLVGCATAAIGAAAGGKS